MILTATINEVKRRILFDNPQAVVAVKGDYEVNGIAFAFPAIYEDDFDLSTAVKTVYYKATDGVIYNHVVTDTDTDTGYPLWVFKDEINKGAFGDVEFALVCDKVEGGNIVKRWVSMITAFRVQKSIEIDESEQEENEQTYSERLAYLMTQMANMQATVSGLASGAPTPESLVANMQEGRIYVYTGTETGYTAGHVYYYVNGTLTDGGQYGGIAIDDTLTSPTMAAPASAVGQIKEDLSDVQKAVDANNVSFTTGGYIATNKNVSGNIDLTPTASAGYAYSVVDCKYDDVFVLTGTGGGTPRLWAFVDAHNALISKSDASLTAEGIILTAPYNAKKLIINVSIVGNNKYSCIIHPSDFVQDLSNSAKINIKFDASQYIDTSGDAVACMVGVDGTEFTKAYNFSYCCAVVPCAYGDKIQITGKSTSSNKHVWTFVNKNGTAISKASANGDLTDEVISVPKNASYCIINARMDSAFSATLFFAKKTLESDYSFSSGYITTPSVNNQINYTAVSSTDFVHVVIDCVKGQKFKITGVTENNSGKRLYCFADLSDYCRYRYNDTTEMIDTEIEAPVNGKLIVNALVNRDYAVTDNYPYALRNPLSTLPPAFMGSMAFKPMGALSKGYICLMTDDGYDNGTDKGLVQETIPLAIAKNVPFTFALMRDSDVCKDSTLLAAVKDAVANHGCSIAQHGEFVWHNKSEDMLNTFFDLEKAFWDSEGIEVKGAVVPAHYTTELVKAVCGGRFGVVRSGYDGIIPGTQNPSYTVTNHYSYYTSGEQSNLYCLSSYNNSSVTEAYNQAAVDYAQANNKILICYFHENSMNATKWGVVGNMIDYAKSKGLEFITLGDIPLLL